MTAVCLKCGQTWRQHKVTRNDQGEITDAYSCPAAVEDAPVPTGSRRPQHGSDGVVCPGGQRCAMVGDACIDAGCCAGEYPELIEPDEAHKAAVAKLMRDNSRPVGSIDSKPTNPKDLIGTNKLPLDLWPATATAMGSLAMLEGALKYGKVNWREMGVSCSVYLAACKRHIDAYEQGEYLTPDSGIPHLSNALACLAIIVDAEAGGNLIDDRPMKLARNGYRKLVEKLTPHVERLRKMFADKHPKHYTIADSRDESVE